MTDMKEVGDTQKVPEETVDTENESTQAVSVSEQAAAGESADSETGSKKYDGEEKKTEEEKAAADSSATAKESSSVEGDDQKKRFVVFLSTRNQNGYLCCIGSFLLAKFGCSYEGGKKRFAHLSQKFSFVILYPTPSTHSHPTH